MFFFFQIEETFCGGIIMKEQNAIEVTNITKSFKIYQDKGNTLKEKILFKNRRKYEERKVLDGISFEVKKGEAIGLIGSNGCGKSTTLKLLTKIMYPDSGKIEMKGRVSSLIELGAGFHPDMSGRENIYINASIFGLNKKEIDKRLENIIAFSELEEFIDNPVRTYSSGMYMRLAFSVAINVDADILLIDEILAVGDANFQTKCFDYLRELKASGMTIVLVTHDTGTVERFCDAAIWINNGKIAAEGKTTLVIDKYMQFMNTKKMEGIQREEKFKNTIEDDKDRKDKIEYLEKVDETTLYKQAMDYNVKHFGLQQAIITKARLLNDKDEETSILMSNSKYKIEIFYKMKNTMEELVFGMGIYTLEGTWIFGTNTMLSQLKIFPKNQQGLIVYHGDEMNLLSGKYILQISITDVNGTPIDFYREYLKFDVINARRDAGIIYMKNYWEVKE